jgi:hypothetical protein
VVTKAMRTWTARKQETRLGLRSARLGKKSLYNASQQSTATKVCTITEPQVVTWSRASETGNSSLPVDR